MFLPPLAQASRLCHKASQYLFNTHALQWAATLAETEYTIEGWYGIKKWGSCTLF